MIIKELTQSNVLFGKLNVNFIVPARLREDQLEMCAKVQREVYHGSDQDFGSRDDAMSYIWTIMEAQSLEDLLNDYILDVEE